MNNQQWNAIRLVRGKLLHFLADEHAQRLDVVDECGAALAAMNVEGPARTILSSVSSVDFLMPWHVRAAARAALPFLNLPTKHLFASLSEAAQVGPLFDSLSQLIEKDHATTIRLTVEPATNPGATFLEDTADRLQADLVNVTLAGKYLRQGRTSTASEVDAVNDIRDAAEHLRQAALLLRAAATKGAQS